MNEQKFSIDQYGWADLTIYLLGVPLSGARGFTLKCEQEKDLIFGAGNNPQGVGRGNKSYSGELRMLQSDFEDLLLAAGGNPLVLRNLVFVFEFEGSDGTRSIKKVYGAQFTEFEQGMQQGDQFKEHVLPFVALSYETVQ